MPNNTKMFEYVYEQVVASGGDGDAFIILRMQDIKRVASEFFDFAESKFKGHTLVEHDGNFIVSCNQEYWLFTKNENIDVPNWVDVTIRMY